MKSGCRIKDRNLDHVSKLENALAIDLVVAWRIFCLNLAARETPDLPCTELLSEDEWRTLHVYAKQEAPPKQPISLYEAVRLIAKLGGFLGRKSDGEPGTITLWRGLLYLQAMTIGFKLAEAFYSQSQPRDGP